MQNRSNDGYVGVTETICPVLEPISFLSNSANMTRASHEESAALLNEKFYVYGSKTLGNETSPVFDNYQVEYEAASAGKTETNVRDWEYVGKTSKKGVTQDMKYWDYSAKQFDFVAVSGLGEDEYIKNTTDGMRIHVADAAAMTKIFVSDRVTATATAQDATAEAPATSSYKDVVQFQFRRLGAQMRVGFYETVPGYAVKDLVFYYIGAPSGSTTVGVGGAFPKSGTYTVSYADKTNAATVKFAGANNVMAFGNQFGTLAYTTADSRENVPGKPYLNTDGSASATAVNAFLGTTSATATYGKDAYVIDGKPNVLSDYKPILPNENNSLKMQLRLDYTLVALDGSGDEIHVRDAYVSVPVEHLQWKPNYSYTYLFKISAKSNGYTSDEGIVTTGPGRDPDPEKGGDNDPEIDPTTGEVIPPYIPDPNYPKIEDPDNPGELIPDPEAPLIPNPDYPEGPKDDQHDPSNPVPVPTIPDPDNPGGEIPDPDNPSKLFPITFDAVVVEAEEGGQTIYTDIE
ncbi:MAG: hypothetical protein IJV06_04780 [Bacteroidaceae bacterium]|nr:hypothetical protein [Bacteroidaceae bacterium]